MMRTKKNGGYTFIELLVVIAAVTLVGVAIFDFQRTIFSRSRLFSGELAAEQDARTFIREFVREARSAGPSEMGAYTIAAAASSSITFYADGNEDGITERIRYYLQGTTLKKGVIVPTGNPLTYNLASEVLQDEVRFVVNGTSTDLFSFFDTNYAGTTSPIALPVPITSIRLVRMTVHIDAQPTKPPDSFKLTTQVTMRNLKDNL